MGWMSELKDSVGALRFECEAFAGEISNLGTRAESHESQSRITNRESVNVWRDGRGRVHVRVREQHT